MFYGPAAMAACLFMYLSLSSTPTTPAIWSQKEVILEIKAREGERKLGDWSEYSRKDAYQMKTATAMTIFQYWPFFTQYLNMSNHILLKINNDTFK